MKCAIGEKQGKAQSLIIVGEKGRIEASTPYFANNDGENT